MNEHTKLRTWAACLLLGAIVGLSGCSDSDGDFDFDGSGSGGAGGGGGGGGNPPAGESSCRIDGTALCAIPTIGEAIVSGAGGACPDNAGQLTPLQLCGVPGVGQPLAENICGVSCPVGDPGAEPPLSLEQLCAIPTLGQQIVEGAGGSCPPPGGGGSSGTLLHDGSAVGPVVDPLDEAAVTPISDAGLSVVLEPVADTVANPLLDALGAEGDGGGGGGGAPSPEQLCAIPAPIGPGLAGALGATCPGGGGGGGGGAPATPISGQCLPGDPTGQLCAP